MRGRVSVGRISLLIWLGVVVAIPATAGRPIRSRLAGWMRLDRGGGFGVFEISQSGVERVSVWWGQLYRDQRTKSPIAWTRDYRASDGATVNEIWVYRHGKKDGDRARGGLPEGITRMLRIKTVAGNSAVTLHEAKGNAGNPPRATQVDRGRRIDLRDGAHLLNAELAYHQDRREAEARAELVLQKKYDRRQRRRIRAELASGLLTVRRLAAQLEHGMLEGVKVMKPPEETWPVIIESIDELPCRAPGR